jgi:hypothetical protein
MSETQPSTDTQRAPLNMGRLTAFGDRVYELNPFALALLCGLRLAPSAEHNTGRVEGDQIVWDATEPLHVQFADVALLMAFWAVPDSDPDDACELAHLLLEPSWSLFS